MDKEKREYLGREVRNVWVEFAKEQSDPKPSHLLGWDELDESNKEVDMRIGEHITGIATHDYAQLSQLLQDISTIAKKAQEDMNKATESDWTGILSGGLDDIIALCENGHARQCDIPLDWPMPAYQYGQVVYQDSAVPMTIVGMRYGRFTVGNWYDLVWRYQIADETGWCDGRWHLENDIVLSWMEEK